MEDQSKQLPKYIQVKKRLLSYIQEEQLQPGDLIPSENKLVKLFHVSRNTVRQAIDELVNLNVLATRQGKGTYFKGFKNSGKVRSGLIGVINHTVLDGIYPAIIHGIEDVLHSREYTMVLSNSAHNTDREVASLKRMIEISIDGLIIEPTFSALMQPSDTTSLLLQSLDVPVIFTHFSAPFFSNSSIEVDEFQSGYLSAQYLIQKGHKDIAIIIKTDTLSLCHRLEGFLKALSDHNMQERPEFIKTFVEKDEKEIPGAHFSEELLALGKGRPTAIFYYNDEVALQGFRYLKSRNISIPDEMSILGFDNIDDIKGLTPGLTTFEHPKYSLGRWAAEMLFEELDSEAPLQQRHVKITPELVERESVKQIN